MKVALLIPYFGKWPILFDLYLETLRRNSWLDVFFFTDNDPPLNIPPNARFISFTLLDIEQLFSSILGWTICTLSPYKLCDFRPIYGLAFQEYIKEYDYWGYGDIDVIYGDMESILPSTTIKKFDVISCRKEYIEGSFCLLRNNFAINNLFRESNDFKQISRTKSHMCFDETSFRWNEVKSSSIFHANLPYENFSFLVLRAKQEGRLRTFFETIVMTDIPDNTYVLWNNGKVFHEGREYLHYHYVTEKRLHKMSYPRWSKIPDRFIVTPYGFYTEEEFSFFHFRLIDQLRKLKYYILKGKLTKLKQLLPLSKHSETPQK